MQAEDKGDHYLVNGTKIWTTLAQHADMIFCLVRTSKTEKPQEGISFLLIDMKSPGIDVRPLITLDQSPAPYQEVNQVFFEDVKVPKKILLARKTKDGRMLNIFLNLKEEILTHRHYIEELIN
jgi:alkylation response protein AidB-like acyl-CoA dehydrogenase